MELDEARKQVIKRIDVVFPTCVGVAINNKDFVAQYLEPYRAKRQSVINSYEKKKKIVFCRDCMEGADARGWVLAYKLFVTATTNPLESTKETWLNCQCQHCDFELNTPVPIPKPEPESVEAQQFRALQDMLSKQGHAEQQRAHQALNLNTYTWDEVTETYPRNKADEYARAYGAASSGFLTPTDKKMLRGG